MRDPTSTAERPALVEARPKPKDQWTSADKTYMATQAALPAADQRPLLEPWLAGIWDSMSIDPRVWGIGTTSLLNMRVRDARQQLDRRRIAALRGEQAVLGFAEEQAAWPAAWPRQAPSSVGEAPDMASINADELKWHGLPGIEERWRREALIRAEPVQGELDRSPAWLDLNRQRQPRPARGERPTQGDPPTAPHLRPGFRNVWRRLADPTIHRPFRLTCQRILHTGIGVKDPPPHSRPGEH